MIEHGGTGYTAYPAPFKRGASAAQADLRSLELGPGLTSPALLAELPRVLADKFEWEQSMVETAIGQVARIGTVVRPADVVSVIHQDPDDDRVLEAAREGSADVIVSGDRHLLRLGSWEAIRILRVAELLENLEP